MLFIITGAPPQFSRRRILRPTLSSSMRMIPLKVHRISIPTVRKVKPGIQLSVAKGSATEMLCRRKIEGSGVVYALVVMILVLSSHISCFCLIPVCSCDVLCVILRLSLLCHACLIDSLLSVTCIVSV